MGDEGMLEGSFGAAGMSRRELIRRGAIVGGAVMWATPVIQSLTTPAAALSLRTVNGQGISFVAFCFTCGGSTFYAKVENPGKANSQCFDTVGGNQCEPACANPSPGGCSRFSLQVTGMSGNEVTEVAVTLNQGCTFSGGTGAPEAKCGSQSGDCHAATVSANPNGTQTAIFSCPFQP